jgi:Flp pilus assembly protein TadD
MHATQRKVRQAILDYQTAIRLDPSDPANYNFLGYALAWAHDLEGARKALTQYRNMLPGDANPIDSLGDVNYMLGDFAAAEKLFVEAHDKDPSVRGGRELLKAAEAALFAGDLAHADANFHKFIDYQRAHHSPTIETELAQWEFLTGRRKQAMARMEKQLATGNGEVAVLSGAQLGFWKLQTGDRPGALELAMDSGRRATSPVARTQAAIVAFLAQSAPAKSSSPLVNGVALLLAHRPADAIAPLRQVFDKTHPSFDGQVRTLLAWAEVDTGRVQDAKSLVDLYPEPFTSGGEALFYSLTFPRFLELRATVLKAEQKSEEARRMEELYRKFAGDVPDRF